MSDVIDMHCHFIPPDLPDFTTKLDDPRWPVLRVGPDDQFGSIKRGEAVFRVVDRACWDTSARLAAMDAQGVARQVMSPIPVALTYWAEPDPALAYARHINDWAAEQVRLGDGRIVGFGTVPVQHPEAATAELERAILELGLSGIEIGTIINGLELSAPPLRPFFGLAEELAVPIFVHPMARYHGYAMDRCGGERESMAIEMLTDTTMAATALVFGGVLADHPNLRICLSHGGGTFTWAYPRLRHWECEQSDDATATAVSLDQRTRNLYVDSLVFDPSHLPLIKQRYGIEHIVAGSDYPFMPIDKTHPSLILDRAEQMGFLTAGEVEQIKWSNALGFLKR